MSLAISLVMAAPLIPILRSDRKLTWASAVLLGTLLTAVAIMLIGEVPSRILYWFDKSHASLAERYAFLRWWEDDVGGNPGYQVVADIVANTVQGTFFIALAAGAYFWGERHRKQGRF